MLEAREVTLGYGNRTVVKGVTFDVPEGRLVGLVGPNGAGKSTLLKSLYGAVRLRSGRVLLDGLDIASLSPAQIAQTMGVVPQNSNPAFPVSVTYYVGMGRFAREPFLGGPTVTDREVVSRCIEELHLEAIADRPVDSLSGGEFRRVLIAQALAQEPRILLFDEPVQQLDLLHQLEVMEFARAFTRRGGTAGLVVLHDLGLAARYCDSVVLLHDGRVLAMGSAEDVLTPEHVKTAYGVDVAIERIVATDAIHVVPIAPASP